MSFLKIEYQREWCNKNRDKIREYNRKSHMKNKEKNTKTKNVYYLKNQSAILAYRRGKYGNRKKEIFKLLGDKCKHCGITDIRVLQIDHINGGGCSEIKEKRTHGTMNYYYLQMITNEDAFLKKYQLLCANCNWIKRYEQNEN